MNNHFHLVTETPRANLVDGMQCAGEEIRQSALAKAQRISEEELNALGWGAEDLLRRRKADPRKIRIAARLRHETTMTLEWITARLHMGVPTYVAALLHRQGRKQTGEKTLF